MAFYLGPRVKNLISRKMSFSMTTSIIWEEMLNFLWLVRMTTIHRGPQDSGTIWMKKTWKVLTRLRSV